MNPIKNQKIELKFMDLKVKIEGQKDVEKRALKLLSALIQDRMRIFEALSELDHEDDEDSELKQKNKKLRPEISNLQKGYV